MSNKSEVIGTIGVAVGFRELMQETYFIDSVSGHNMPTDATSQARVTIILDVISRLAKMKK